MKKCDLLSRLLDEGWFADEREALPWIIERRVLVADVPAASLHIKVAPDAEIRVREYYKKRYVNRGGLKLEGAFDDFGIRAEGLAALDCGASTGGFTDCLLQHGAVKVYAVDAGHGQLAGKLMQDERVENLENTNLSDPSLLTLEPKPRIITLDLSYLSLTAALPTARSILRGEGEIISLVKPNFEAAIIGRESSGVIEDAETLSEILSSLAGFAAENGFDVLNVTRSRIRGSGGAVEFFLHLRCSQGSVGTDINEKIQSAVKL